jgi:HK97 family phage prohead protease
MSVENIYQIKNGTIGATIDDVDGKKGIVTGYFSHFNNVDADGDIIRPGAFKKSIKENGPNSAQPRIKHLMNHDPSQPLGKLMTLKEDSTGLAYESQIGTHRLGEDFVKMVESGLITEHSIGFRIMKRNQMQPYEEYMKNPGKGYYEITELKLYEGSSLTAWGANPLTPITGLKSLGDIDVMIAHTNAIEKFCRNTDASDETIEMLLLHSKQLAQLVIDIKSSTPPVETTVPQNDVLDAIREFKQLLKN